MILAVILREWRERTLCWRATTLPSLRQSLSTVGRCNDAITLVRIVVNSSCEDDNAALGNEKACSSET